MSNSLSGDKFKRGFRLFQPVISYRAICKPEPVAALFVVGMFIIKGEAPPRPYLDSASSLPAGRQVRNDVEIRMRIQPN